MGPRTWAWHKVAEILVDLLRIRQTRKYERTVHTPLLCVVDTDRLITSKSYYTSTILFRKYYSESFLYRIINSFQKAITPTAMLGNGKNAEECRAALRAVTRHSGGANPLARLSIY